MSFRLFIYYCALCGGGGGFLGWALGRMFVSSSGVFGVGMKGMCLGLGVALALSLLDAIWNLSLTQIPTIAARVGSAVLVGALGGLLGGIVAQLLFDWKSLSFFLVFGWTFTGFLIGASLGTFDLFAVTVRGQEISGAIRKMRNGVIGGTGGGLLGGILYLMLRGAWLDLFQNKPSEKLWSPSALGFVALGACIGLLIALAQVFLKEAWLKVESGFRKGREQILSKPEITIGRAEACDVGLFGDPQIDKFHAKIRREGNRYVVIDEGSSTGTFVNENRLQGPHTLQSGDTIRLGKSVLRYGEREQSTK